MLKIDRKTKRFTRLENPSLAEVSISERYDLQEFISNSPEDFFKELGMDLFLISKEVMPSKNVQDRIDLLAIDKEGASVVIELKRGNNKLQLFQAISYAGMISQWPPDEFLEYLDASKTEQLADFLEVDIQEINRSQRIVLIAEEFDYSLLIGTEWLSDNYGVDVMCCRISVAKDLVSSCEYLVCSNVYPAPELIQQATQRGHRNPPRALEGWNDWESALSDISNPVLVEFFKKQLNENRESYLLKRIIHYRVDGKRRWFVVARQNRAYVWQNGRFDSDIEYWTKGLGEKAQVKPVKRGKCLSFFLETKKEFEFFQESTTQKLIKTKWFNESADEELVDPESWN